MTGQEALGLMSRPDLAWRIVSQKCGVTKPETESDWKAFLSKLCDDQNKKQGELTGFNCKRCMNRGFHFVPDFENMKPRRVTCTCMESRASIERMERSGLASTIRTKTFDAFRAVEPWQEQLKADAMKFAKEKNGWFFISGQSGCGKTHICTAICREFLLAGIPVKYVTWRDTVQKLRSAVNDTTNYQNELRPLVSVRVLYVDDFLKVGKNAPPSTSDISIAYEIINARYLNPNLVTIISTERGIEEIMDYDEALGGRICERSEYMPCLSGKEKNWRMRNDK